MPGASYILRGPVRSFAQTNDSSCRRVERTSPFLARKEVSRDAMRYGVVEWFHGAFRIASLPHLAPNVGIYDVDANACGGEGICSVVTRFELRRVVARNPSETLLHLVRRVTSAIRPLNEIYMRTTTSLLLQNSQVFDTISFIDFLLIQYPQLFSISSERVTSILLSVKKMQKRNYSLYRVFIWKDWIESCNQYNATLTNKYQLNLRFRIPFLFLRYSAPNPTLP